MGREEKQRGAEGDEKAFTDGVTSELLLSSLSLYKEEIIQGISALNPIALVKASGGECVHENLCPPSCTALASWLPGHCMHARAV